MVKTREEVEELLKRAIEEINLVAKKFKVSIDSDSIHANPFENCVTVSYSQTYANKQCTDLQTLPLNPKWYVDDPYENPIT